MLGRPCFLDNSLNATTVSRPRCQQQPPPLASIQPKLAATLDRLTILIIKGASPGSNSEEVILRRQHV